MLSICLACQFDRLSGSVLVQVALSNRGFLPNLELLRGGFCQLEFTISSAVASGCRGRSAGVRSVL